MTTGVVNSTMSEGLGTLLYRPKRVYRGYLFDLDGTIYLGKELLPGPSIKTKKQLWRYEHRLGTTIFCCGPNNRGMAIHGPHVYMGTLDARLVALDKKTGEVAWDIEVADPTYGYSITHAPSSSGAW